MVSCKVKSLGLEADLGRWHRFQRSVVANHFEDSIQTMHALVGSGDEVNREEFEGSEFLSFVPNVALDELWSEAVDILKIHINGGEHFVLRGAKRLFQLGVTAAVWVSVA